MLVFLEILHSRDEIECNGIDTKAIEKFDNIYINKIRTFGLEGRLNTRTRADIEAKAYRNTSLHLKISLYISKFYKILIPLPFMHYSSPFSRFVQRTGCRSCARYFHNFFREQYFWLFFTTNRSLFELLVLLHQLRSKLFD